MTITMRLQALREALVVVIVLAAAIAYGLIVQQPPLLAPDAVKVELETLEAQVAALTLPAASHRRPAASAARAHAPVPAAAEVQSTTGARH